MMVSARRVIENADEDSPMDAGDAVEAPKCFNPPTEQDHKIVWNHIEKGARFLNADATPYEKSQMMNHNWGDVKSLEMAEKVKNMFGQAKGAGNAAKSLLLKLSEGKQPGEEAEWDSVEWTLCKHLMVAGWKKLSVTSPPGPGLDGEPPVVCHCLPCTAFMVKGCPHKKFGLEKNDHPYQILCEQCSKCLRCEG